MDASRRAVLAAGMIGGAAALAGCQTVAGAGPADHPLTLDEAVRDAPDPSEVITLWPGGAPGGEKVTAIEAVVPRDSKPGTRDRYREHIRTPTLTVFRPAKPNGVAIVMAPGGAYVRVVMDKEGYESARWLASRGFTCFVLMYRMPGDGWAAGPRVALQDAQRAIRVVRSRASEYGVDPKKILMMGFSAGGHVAGSAVTRFDEKAYKPVDAADSQSARPDLGCLIYPVIALSGAMAHAGSAEQLLGKQATPEQIKASSADAHVTANTPPTILFHSADDPGVPVGNSLTMFAALKAAKVETEMHIFAEGQHGWGLRGATDKPAAEWPVLLTNWMARHGLG